MEIPGIITPIYYYRTKTAGQPNITLFVHLLSIYVGKIYNTKGQQIFREAIGSYVLDTFAKWQRSVNNAGIRIETART